MTNRTGLVIKLLLLGVAILGVGATAWVTIVSNFQGRNVSAAAPTNNQVMRWNETTKQWEPGSALESVGAISGDVTGNLDATVVGKIQTRNVSSTAPNDGEGLVWDAALSTWKPGTMGAISNYGTTGEMAASGVSTANAGGSTAKVSRVDHVHKGVGTLASGTGDVSVSSATGAVSIQLEYAADGVGDATKPCNGNDSRLSNARTPTAHAVAMHKHSGTDEVATATPGANEIPKAGADSKLDYGWIPTLSTTFTEITHAHTGGSDGAQVAHASLGDAGTVPHSTLDTHVVSTTSVHNIDAAGESPPSTHGADHASNGSDPAPSDGAVNVGTLRTLGRGAQQACPGSDGALVTADQLTAAGTAPGDMTHYNGAEWVGLIIGSNGYFLTSNGTTPTWSDPTTLRTKPSISGQTNGDVPYYDENLTDWTRLAIGSSGYVLGSNGTTPTWIDPNTLKAKPIISGETNGDIPFYDENLADWTRLAVGSNGYLLGSNGTTPTWVARTQPSLQGLNGLTINGTTDAVVADTFVISPTFGTLADTFTQGNDARLSDKRGPTIASEANGDLMYFDENAARWVRLAKGTNGQLLTTNGTTPRWDDVGASGNVSLTGLAGVGIDGLQGELVSGTSFNVSVAYGVGAETACVGNDARLSDKRAPTIASEALGDIMWHDGTDWIRLAMGSNGQYLTTNGTTPCWGTKNVSLTGVGGVFVNGVATQEVADTFNVSVAYGTEADTACQGNDARLSDTRYAKVDSQANGDLTMYDENLAKWSRIAVGSNGYVLASNGTTPTWTDLTSLKAKPTISSEANGDIAFYDENLVDWTRLAIGSNGYVLTSNGTTPTWTDLTTLKALPTVAGESNGDLSYYDANQVKWVRLGIGTNGQLLQSNGTTPTWASASSSGNVTLTGSAGIGINGLEGSDVVGTTFTVSRSFGSVASLGAADADGSGTAGALANHVHKGVKSVAGVSGVSVSGSTGDVTFQPTYGALANTVAQGNDARFVTNGDSHDHLNGDGGVILHSSLNNTGTYTHAQLDTHYDAIYSIHGIDATGAITPTAHASSHQNGGADEVATATAAANAIPKAGAGGTLGVAWIPQLDHETLSNTGTYTHAQLDTHYDAIYSIHGIDASGRITPSAHSASHRDGTDDLDVVVPLTLDASAGVSLTYDSVDFALDGSSQLILANSGVVAATYGSATQVPQITVDAKGRATSVSAVTITGVEPAIHVDTHMGSATDPMTATVPVVNDATAGISLTYDSTYLTIDGSNQLVPNVSGVTAGTYGNGSNIPQITVDAKGRVTATANTSVTAVLPLTVGTSGVSLTYAATDLTLNGSNQLILANAGTAGTYGTGGHTFPVYTTDAKGRITSTTNTSVTAVSPLTVGTSGVSLTYNSTAFTNNAGVFTPLFGASAGQFMEGNQAPTAHKDSHKTGGTDVLDCVTPLSSSTSGISLTYVVTDLTKDGSNRLILANSGVSATTYGGQTSAPRITVDAKGRITSAVAKTIGNVVPATHSAMHTAAGTDSIKLDDLAAPDDNSDLDASTSKHGLLKKLDNDTSHFLRGDGTWTEPTATANCTLTGSGIIFVNGVQTAQTGATFTLTSSAIVSQESESRLQVYCNDTHKATITADVLTLVDTNSAPIVVRTVSLTPDLDGAIGALGPDVDAANDSNGWKYAWVIAKADGTKSAVWSTSSTLAGVTMPSGYSYGLRVCAAYHDDNGFYEFIKVSNSVYYRGAYNGAYSSANFLVLNAGTSTSFADVDCSAFVPPTSMLARLQIAETSGSGRVQIRENGETVSPSKEYSPLDAYTYIGKMWEVPTGSDQVIEYDKTAGTGIYIYVFGYIER